MTDQPRAYRSIFLDDDWAHQTYHGWSLAEDLTGLRVLRKTRPGLTRTLILLTAGGDSLLAGAMARHASRPGFSDVIIHDFDAILSDEPLIGARRFHRARPDERLLNIATYAIDLTLPEAELWQKLGSKSRNAIRKAEENGAGFVVNAGFPKFTARFYQFHHDVAARHGLDVPDIRVLRKMHDDNRLILVSAVDADGAPVLTNIIYVTKTKAFYLHGASDENVGPGVGQFVQWKTTLLLKSMQFGWYDLGGVTGDSATDGVHRFKKSLGGAFHDLGPEFRRASPGFDFIRSSISRLTHLRPPFHRPTP